MREIGQRSELAELRAEVAVLRKRVGRMRARLLAMVLIARAYRAAFRTDGGGK